MKNLKENLNNMPITHSTYRGNLTLTCTICKKTKPFNGMVAPKVIERFKEEFLKEHKCLKTSN
jgi:hypothetical protein